MLTAILIIYSIIGTIYGLYVCAFTWSSYGGGITPILNGIFSGVTWLPYLLWVFATSS